MPAATAVSWPSCILSFPIYAMEFVFYWIQVSSSCMVKLEVDLMVGIHHNEDL
jgi:hypothetical protein